MLKSTAFWIGIIVGVAAFVADALMKYIVIVIVLLAVACVLMLREWNGDTTGSPTHDQEEAGETAEDSKWLSSSSAAPTASWAISSG
jgi:cell division protein FtsW (lipid II flippase)